MYALRNHHGHAAAQPAVNGKAAVLVKCLKGAVRKQTQRVLHKQSVQGCAYCFACVALVVLMLGKSRILLSR